MNTTGYRVTYTFLSLLLLGIIGASILFIPSGEPKTIPEAVDQYSPLDGDMVMNPIAVMIDVQPNYQVQFVIDGIVIPEAQMNSIVEIGRYEFMPGPGKVIERWAPGTRTVIATWTGGVAGTSTGTLVWTFRVH